MRATILLMLGALLIGCNQKPLPKIDRIDVAVSGDFAGHVSMTSRGEGSFDLLLTRRTGTFSASPRQFTLLLKRLERYQRLAVPVANESIAATVRRCPEGVPSMPDTGGIFIQWTGPGVEQMFYADFACNYDRHARRNDELWSIWSSLPPVVESRRLLHPDQRTRQ